MLKQLLQNHDVSLINSLIRIHGGNNSIINHVNNRIINRLSYQSMTSLTSFYCCNQSNQYNRYYSNNSYKYSSPKSTNLSTNLSIFDNLFELFSSSSSSSSSLSSSLSPLSLKNCKSSSSIINQPIINNKKNSFSFSTSSSTLNLNNHQNNHQNNNQYKNNTHLFQSTSTNRDKDYIFLKIGKKGKGGVTIYQYGINNCNFKLGGIRGFHSNLPNYFVFSKAVRIVLPFAMSGIRHWINKGNKFLKLGAIVAVMLVASGLYIYYNQETTPVTGRTRFIGLSADEEKELGDLSYASVMEGLKDHLLPENNALQNQVRTVAKRLILAIEDPPPFSWECHVCHSNEVNAFVLPNGSIFVYSGLFDIVSTEEELAAVLSHEIGHVLARHAAESMSFLKAGILFLTLTRGLFGDTFTGNISTIFSGKLLELRHSRLHEIEADVIGLRILKSAGYSLDAAIRVQERLAKLSDQGSTTSIFGSWTSTHPSSEERISNMKDWIKNNK